MSSGLREGEKERLCGWVRQCKSLKLFVCVCVCVCAKQKRNKSKAQKFKLQNATKQVEKGERKSGRRRKPDKSNTQSTIKSKEFATLK